MVLGRIASNFVPAERARRSNLKNENTPPSKASRGFRAAFSQKVASSLSSISAASRRRRARLHGGLEKDRHRVTDSARRQGRTQSRSRTHTPPVALNARSAAVSPPQMSPRMVEEEERMETEDCEMADASPVVERSTPIFRGVTLPRRLARPSYRAVNSAALAAIDPGLADTNIEYVRDCLEANGASMLNVLARTTVISTSTKPVSVNGGLGQSRQNTASLPSEATVRVLDTRADLPTHMLAVYSSLPGANQSNPSNGQTQIKTRVSLLPTHAVMLAAHCAAVPPLPVSNPSKRTQGKDSKQAVLTLPVVPLSIPSPTAFPLLSAYLYTQDSDNLLRALLGVPLSPASSPTHVSTPSILLSPADSLPTPAPSPQLLPRADLSPASPPSTLTAEFTARVSQTSRALAAAHVGDADALLKKVGFVMGLWRNAFALGIYDSGLWSTLDAAWAVLLGAMAICERTGHRNTV